MVNNTTLPQTNNPTQIWALIPCAGSGTRAQTVQPKQYQILAGQPLVLHTLNAFTQIANLAGVLVVVAPNDHFFNQHPSPCYTVVNCGGVTRAESVLNGLHALQAEGAKNHDWVLVHDAARCLITPAQISALINACQNDSVGGLLALPLADTLKQENEPTTNPPRSALTLPRTGKWLAQTPQMFRIETLLKALHKTLANGTITDESSAIESIGLHPKLVVGTAHNFKVTYPDDFILAEALINIRKHAQQP